MNDTNTANTTNTRLESCDCPPGCCPLGAGDAPAACEPGCCEDGDDDTMGA